MTATLTFDLPDDRVEFALARNGGDYYATLTEFDEWLRERIKHVNMAEAERAELRYVRQHLLDLCEARNIVLWEEPR